ncbi:STAS domain-containing protein [Streptomyces sp. NPDC018610]|jgi:anti-anti-sigma factor|uniref:STAS domain-containing protein n=1 Tax=Streptomyces sp. NPDC018610 TaxID=3365049 RepID=UPI0037B347E5
MTEPPSTEFAVTARTEPPTLTLRVAGELDYDTCDDFVSTVVGHLTRDSAELSHVRLDFGELTWIDSSGLSALLMIHRHTGAAGAALHLDRRPDFLERMLRVTGVLEHLTVPPTPITAGENDGQGDASPAVRGRTTRL